MPSGSDSAPAVPPDEISELPVPLFRVLQQEYTQIRGVQSPAPPWTLDPDHLIGEVAQLPADLLRLAGAAPTSPKEGIVDSLNDLLLTPTSIARNHRFPGSSISPGLHRLDGLRLGKDDRIRVNRLLLEAAFPEHVRKIDVLSLERHYRTVHEGEGVSGLAISGGGIRSATFALGVLQGLARRGILTSFDYLSTVSGGGYIGSWLSSWIHRKGGDTVQAELGRREAASPLEPEPLPVRNLRAYSNYLTPRLGFLSADTWTLAGIYLCNLLLNWLVFVPVLMAVFALPRLGIAVIHADPPRPVAWAVLAAGLVAGVLGLTFTMVHRPINVHSRPGRRGLNDPRPSQGKFLWGCLLPLWICAICVSTFWVWWNSELEFRLGGYLPKINPGWYYLGVGVGLPLLGWLASQFWARNREPLELASVLLSGIAGGGLLWAVAALASRYVFFHELEGHDRGDVSHFVPEIVFVCLGAPGFLGALLVGGSVFVGLVSKRSWDSDREWWARMGAWVLLTLTCWAGFGLLTLLGPLALFQSKAAVAAVSSVGGLSGLLTLLISGSSRTPAKNGNDADGNPAQGLLNKGLALTTPLFIAFIVILLSIASGALIYTLSRVKIGSFSLASEWTDGLKLTELFSWASYLQAVHIPSSILVLLFVVAGLALGVGMSLVIDVNKFSIHALYRNRLVRAYLGASNAQRRPNPFTGFDGQDDLPISDLRDQKPLHLVNMALNLVGGENLAWQERKAESFTAGPHYCGSHRLGYRPSVSYGRHRKEWERTGPDQPPRGEFEGLTLGTAVAISGAAASPNMGYHSSPVVAALMTFFNLRLGWWLGNPGGAGQSSYATHAPRSGLLYLVKEAFGLTDDSSEYVYLSDGGHFENLALYELILRRCRLIVVSDAGCDPDCSLEDLGNAIRKIRIDLGVDITLRDFDIFSRDENRIGKYCAIGEIDYSRVDRRDGSEPPKGVLIYIKPAVYNQDEPKDVHNYSKVSKAFPNESTSDQWFSESQFESYRVLGMHIVNCIADGKPVRDAGAPTPRSELNDFVARATRYAALQLPDPENGGVCRYQP